MRAREWKDVKEVRITQRLPVEDSTLTVVMTRGKGDAPFSDHSHNFLPKEVPTTIAIRRKSDIYGVDMSCSGKDTIIDQTAESPWEAYWKSQVQKSQLLRSSPSMSLEGYSGCQNDSSTQGMFTPSPDDFGRNGEWSAEIYWAHNPIGSTWNLD